MDQEVSVRPCGDRKRQSEEEAEKGAATESIRGHSPTETHFVLSTHLSRTPGQEGGGGMPKIRICTSPTPQEWRRGHLKLGRAEMKQNQISLGHLPSKGLAKLESTVSGEVCSETLLQ